MSAQSRSTHSIRTRAAVSDSAKSVSEQTSSALAQSGVSTKVRRIKLGRFLTGLLLTALGVSSILLVGISLIHVRRVRADLALPVVGFSVLTGVMLLGGGFGLMATAAGGFDEEEFDRLMNRSAEDGVTEMLRMSSDVEQTPQAISVPVQPNPSEMHDGTSRPSP